MDLFEIGSPDVHIRDMRMGVEVKAVQRLSQLWQQK